MLGLVTDCGLRPWPKVARSCGCECQAFTMEAQGLQGDGWRWLDMAFENVHVQGPVQINDEKYVIPYDLKMT